MIEEAGQGLEIFVEENGHSGDGCGIETIFILKV